MSITKDFYTVFVLTNDNKPVKQLEESVFVLRHGEEYKVKILNHHTKLRANASISIDDKNIGYFRINADSSITVERPVRKDRRLIFYKRGTPQMGWLESNNPHTGILRVTVEQEEPGFTKDLLWDEADTTVVFSMGGTALGGTSSQRLTPSVTMGTKDKVTVIRALMVSDSELPVHRKHQLPDYRNW